MMKILIKLNKRLYKYANHHTLTASEIDEICDVIANGILLPEEHGICKERLIEYAYKTIDKADSEEYEITNKEAIEQLKHMKVFIGYDAENPMVKKMQSALDFATKVLERKAIAEDIDMSDELQATAINMISDDYKERFKAEYKQLKIRLDKLTYIIKNYEHLDFLPKTPESLLYRQHIKMSDYLEILRERAIYEGINLD